MPDATVAWDFAASSPPRRDDILARYRRLRSISKMHYEGSMVRTPSFALIRAAERLGLVHDKTVLVDRADDLTLASDLALYTAPRGRSTALDRYARAESYAAGSEEAQVLEAMRAARFALVVVKDKHPSAGLIVFDLYREAEIWLMDTGLEKSLPQGCGFATRYFKPDSFAMTCGVVVPIDYDLVEAAVASASFLKRMEPADALDDPRFAEAIYRTALSWGVMERVEMRDVPDLRRLG